MGRADLDPAAADAPATLDTEIDHLGQRVYSEEGIPMILVCQDLTAKQPVPSASPAMNAAVATALERYAALWQQSHPQAATGDTAKLVELIAVHDFAAGGRDGSL